MEIVLVPLELRPNMPDEGLKMSEFEAAGHSDRVEQHLIRVAARDGIQYANPRFLPKTHRALALAEMARDRGSDAHLAMHHAIFRSYFGENKDIGTEDVLLGIAREQGFAPEDVRTAWDKGTYDERLHKYRHLAIQLGITSTPAALVCNELLIGSRPYKVIREAVERCLVMPVVPEEGAAGSGAQGIAASPSSADDAGNVSSR